MSEDQLDMRSVTDIVTEGSEENFQSLNGETEEERNIAYAKQICEVLSSSGLVYTGLWGAINTIYQPKIEGKIYENIAVKLVDAEKHKDPAGLRFAATNMPEEEVGEVLKDKNLFFSAIHPYATTKGELTTKELELVHLAHDHKIFQQLYGEFVFPALFVCYQSKKNKDGDAKGAMVQNYVKDVRYIGEDRMGIQHTDWDTLSENEIHNLSGFADKLESVFLETGCYPDEKMLENENLGLTEDGRVILLDTNIIRRISDESERKRLMDSVAQHEFAIGPFRPIKFIREKVSLWNEKHRSV
jgi:hypothetical protein